MPRALLINPNSTEAMTEAMLATARAAAPKMEISGWTSASGPPAIQGPDDGKLAVPPLLELIREARSDFDVIIIGCFDDTGLADANALAPCPVIGIGQAAFHMAALRHQRFAVVTTLEVSVPVIDANITAYGLQSWSGGVFASGVPVLETEGGSEASHQRILATAQRVQDQDAKGAIILGCGGMSGLTEMLRTHLSCPVIDGVDAAARLGAAIV